VQSSLLDVLEMADGSRRLPRLGGMARPTGVVIASERFWAFAGVDGSLVEGAMPQPPKRLMRLPLLRGLLRLGLALAPIARRTGTATRPERLLLLGALVLPFGLVFLPATIGLALGSALTFALLLLLFRGPTLRLHGAEHRAIAAAEERRLLASWDGSARPSRFSLRCGTNFAVLAAPVTVLAERLLPLPAAMWSPAVVTVFSLALTMELWQAVQASGSRFAKVFLLPGLGAQRLTTREPDLAQTHIALRAVASVLQREAAS
jgi:Protein of unknown function (DUF1385)